MSKLLYDYIVLVVQVLVRFVDFESGVWTDVGGLADGDVLVSCAGLDGNGVNVVGLQK